jgi:hypothetical protein
VHWMGAVMMTGRTWTENRDATRHSGAMFPDPALPAVTTLRGYGYRLDPREFDQKRTRT